MALEQFLRKQAKRYQTLPFEMRIVLGPILYFLALTNQVHDLLHPLTKLFKLPPIVLKKGRNSFLRSIPSLVKKLSLFTHKRKKKPVIIFEHKKKPIPQKKKRKTVLSPLIPITYKLRYFFIGSVFSFFFFFFPLLVFLFLQDLPHPKELTLRQIPQTTKIYDRNHVLLYQIYASQNRTIIPLASVPKHLQEATLSIEDKNFYKHPGFDITSIIRAAKENITGGTFQGGSTITQQLIKSSMLTPEPSFVRKVKEIILAFWAEHIYTKNQILEMYFNQVPYGGTAWGIEAAAEVYFNKRVQELTLGESAFLAGITSAPSIYSPYGIHPNAWKSRQKEVLNRMASLGYITKKQATDAWSTPLQFQTPKISIQAPHFVNYVKELLVQKYGLPMVEKGGLTVITSLDLTLQKQVQKIVTEEVNNAFYLNVSNGAVLVTDPKNGDILAMVGSKDYNSENGGNVNLTTSLRQPGSSVKIITYSAALAHGLTAASIIDDTPTTFAVAGGPSYSPVNYGGKYFGKVSIRSALANSLNVAAVKTLNQIGVPTMVQLGKDMGISHWGDPSTYGLSVTLGGSEVTMLDMATVVGTLANQGRRVDLSPIREITTSKGDKLLEKTKPDGIRVLDQGIAYIISDILADNPARTPEFGPNSPLFIPGHTVSVKTGTSDNKRDNWTVGYTNNVAVVTWVGNNDNSPMSPNLASGITGAAPIWHRVMEQMITKKKEEPFPKPENVISKACFGKVEYFIKGTEGISGCQPFTTPTMFKKTVNLYVPQQ